MLIRRQTTNLHQIFCEISLHSQVIFKSMKVADDISRRTLECEWVNNTNIDQLLHLPVPLCRSGQSLQSLVLAHQRSVLLLQLHHLTVQRGARPSNSRHGVAMVTNTHIRLVSSFWHILNHGVHGSVQIGTRCAPHVVCHWSSARTRG